MLYKKYIVLRSKYSFIIGSQPNYFNLSEIVIMSFINVPQSIGFYSEGY